MRRDYKATLSIGEGTIYADTVEDISIVLSAMHQEHIGARSALEEDLRAKRDRCIDLEAELKDWKETHVYGPQLHAEKEEALRARDQALRQLETTETSRRSLDDIRRALAAKVRSLEEANEHLAGTVLEQRRILDRHARRGVKGARKR